MAALANVDALAMQLIAVARIVVVLAAAHQQKAPGLVDSRRRFLEWTVSPCPGTVVIRPNLRLAIRKCSGKTPRIGFEERVAVMVLLRDPHLVVVHCVMIGKHQEVIPGLLIQQRRFQRKRPTIRNKRMRVDVAAKPFAFNSGRRRAD